MAKQYCDQCENHCPEDALQCGRGRRHFGLESAEGGEGRRDHDRQMPGGAVGLLLQCGHILHHGSAAGEDLLSALSVQEQAELERLLEKLLTDWKSRMPAEGHGHGHGRHA